MTKLGNRKEKCSRGLSSCCGGVGWLLLLNSPTLPNTSALKLLQRSPLEQEKSKRLLALRKGPGRPTHTHTHSRVHSMPCGHRCVSAGRLARRGLQVISTPEKWRASGPDPVQLSSAAAAALLPQGKGADMSLCSLHYWLPTQDAALLHWHGCIRTGKLGRIGSSAWWWAHFLTSNQDRRGRLISGQSWRRTAGRSCPARGQSRSHRAAAHPS